MQSVIKIKLFVNIYNWKGINFLSKRDAWKKFEKKSLTIAFNVLYAKKEKLYPDHVSKHNSNCEKQVVLLMMSNGEGWNYLSV